MIINDEYKFAFVHIPKCAGTTVRMSLEKYDSLGGKYSSVNSLDTSVGLVDMAHIPLGRLRELHLNDYNKIKNYTSFAIMRDPSSRFPSSLYQHLSMYSAKPVREMCRQEFVTSLEKIIKLLDNRDTYLEHELIHFQRQKDYIYDGDEKIVSNVYMPQDINKMFKDLTSLTGNTIMQHQQVGEGFVYRDGWESKVAIVLNKVYADLLKGVAPQYLVKYLKSKLMQKPANAYSDIFNSNTVQSFIQDYYKSDYELINRLRNNINHES